MLALLRSHPSCQISARKCCRPWSADARHQPIIQPLASQRYSGHIHLVVEPYGENFSSQTKLHNNLHNDPMESAGLETMELRRTSCGDGRPNLILVCHRGERDICTPQRLLLIFLLLANSSFVMNPLAFAYLKAQIKQIRAKVAMIPSRPHALERAPDPYQAFLGLGKFALLTAMLCSQSVAPELLGFTHDDEALLRLFLQTRSVSHGLNSELFEQGRYPSGGKVLLDHGPARMRSST